jgi:hypothetical protein
MTRDQHSLFPRLHADDASVEGSLVEERGARSAPRDDHARLVGEDDHLATHGNGVWLAHARASALAGAASVMVIFLAPACAMPIVAARARPSR